MANIYGIKDAANLNIIDKKTGKPFLYTNYATVTTNEWTAENVYAHSKDVNAIRWDYGRQGTLNVSFEIFDLKLIAMMVGSSFETNSGTLVAKSDSLALASGAATLTETPAPIGGGLKVWASTDGTTKGLELTEVAGTPGVGEYKITGKTINVDSAEYNQYLICEYNYLDLSTLNDIFAREQFTINSANPTATLSGTIADGNITVFKTDYDGITNLLELEASTSAPNAGQYKLDGNTITLNALDFNNVNSAYNQIAVYYLKPLSSSRVLNIDFNKYASNYIVYGDTLIRDTSGVDIFCQMKFLNCKPQSNFTITMSASEVTTLEIPFDIFKNDASNAMATYTLY